MLKTRLKKIPLLYTAALYYKHSLLAKKTKKAFLGYLTNSAAPKLQLGAGANELSGWFNTDYFNRPAIHFLDVTKKLPFPANTFACIFTEHQIEHIKYSDALFMLTESFRTLQPGGVIKVITPNLQKYVSYYTEGKLSSELIKTHVNNWIYSGFYNAINYVPVDEYYDAHFINDIFFNYGHCFIYDEHALISLLKKAGFININTGQSNYPEFENINSHNSEFDSIFNLAVTAEKPE
ncbi:MAG: hypothetical protein V4456_09425 [Bacteroidota bacterium]